MTVLASCTRCELATEEAAINNLIARNPAKNKDLMKCWVDGRAKLRRELVVLSQRLVEARAETSRLQGEIAELLNPPFLWLQQQIFDQRAQFAKEMEDVVLLRTKQQLLTELTREHQEGRKTLQANGHAG
jgi:hypothetical protein